MRPCRVRERVRVRDLPISPNLVLLEQLEGARVEEPDRAVRGGGGEARTVGVELDGTHLRSVVVEGVHAAVALRIPQLDGLVVAAGGDESAVWRELGAAHPVGVAGEGVLTLTLTLALALALALALTLTQLEWPESEYLKRCAGTDHALTWSG